MIDLKRPISPLPIAINIEDNGPKNEIMKVSRFMPEIFQTQNKPRERKNEAKSAYEDDLPVPQRKGRNYSFCTSSLKKGNSDLLEVSNKSLATKEQNRTKKVFHELKRWQTNSLQQLKKLSDGQKSLPRHILAQVKKTRKH